MNLGWQFIELLLLAIEEFASLLRFAGFRCIVCRRGSDGHGSHAIKFPTLADPVFVAARVFADPPFPLKDKGARHHVVEECSVVGNEQEGSFVVYQQFLQQFEGLCIEIVGRLIQDENIGRLKEEAGQKQAVALSSREHLGRHPYAIRGKEKILQVGVDVDGASLECHGFRSAGHIVPEALFPVDLIAELVKVDDLESGSELHLPLRGSQFIEEQFEQGCFSTSVGADDPDLVPLPESRREVVHNGVFPVSEGDALGLDDLLSRVASFLQFDLCGTHAFTSFSPLGTQRFQGAHTALVACAARLHPLAKPRLFLRELLVKSGPLLDLRIEAGCLALQIGIVVAGPAGQFSPIQFDDAGGELLQECPVVRHKKEGRFHLQQKGLEPEYRFEVEVVGRLVEHENIGLSHQRPRQKNAAFQAAGEALEWLLGR